MTRRAAIIAGAQRAQRPRPAFAGQRPARPQPIRRPAGRGAPAPTPWSSPYEQAVAGANRRYGNTQAALNLDEQRAQQEYGLAPGFNDYQSNPYSRAAELEQSYRSAKAGTMTGVGNQLYSGSTQGELEHGRAVYAKGRDALQRSYQDAMAGITTGRAQSAEDLAEARQQADWERVGEAEGMRPEALTAPRGRRARPQRRAATRRAVRAARQPRYAAYAVRSRRTRGRR